VEHAVVVEVQADHGVARLGVLRLFLDAFRLSVSIEFDHTVALRLFYRIGEHGRAPRAARSALQQQRQLMTVKKVVSQNQRNRIGADELSTYEERLREATWRRLHGVGETHAQARAVAQQLLEPRGILRRGYDEDVANPGEHQRRQGIVDQRFVINRQ